MDAKSKKKIEEYAKKCGLSMSEYLRQRAIGYEPRESLPYLFILQEKIGNIGDKVQSKEIKEEIDLLLQEITDELILPGRNGKNQWQSQTFTQ